jgi:hypothetical protein
MDGWIVHLYVKVPRLFIVTGSLVAPEPSTCVVNVLLSATASWDRVSVFFQTTRCPTFTVVGLGAKDCAPLMPVMLMVMSGPGVGVLGAEGVELLPHAAAVVLAMTTTKINLFMRWGGQTMCRRVR